MFLRLLAQKAIIICDATLGADQENGAEESRWQERLSPGDSPWEPGDAWRRGPAHHAQAAGELAQEIMLVELHAGLVLVEQGKLELLHLLKVVVEDELLGEGGVEVVDRSFRPVVLAERGRGGNRSQSQTRGLVPLFTGCWESFCSLAER